MMTSSEGKTSENATQAIPKKMGNETVTLKASFKSPGTTKPSSQRVARKVVLPISTVQALTFKFNELSQLNEGQKPKTAVKNVIGINRKPSSIKVVICRKPSLSRYKRGDDVVVRRKVSTRRANNVKIIEEKPDAQKSVHAKVSEFEGKELSLKPVLKLDKEKTKVHVPKILVNIDLESEDSNDNQKNGGWSTERNTAEDNVTKNTFSVKSAITLFEQNLKSNTLPKNTYTRTKSLDFGKPKEDQDSNNCIDQSIRRESVPKIKTKPIAAIKPILKKSEDKSARKIKLSPKDSLNRKKYIGMKREPLKENGCDDSDEEAVSDSVKEGVIIVSTNQTNVNKDNVAGSNLVERHQKERNDTAVSQRDRNSSMSAGEEESEKLSADAGNQSLKPNTSFLWSKKEEIYGERRPSSRMDIPLPVPPENYIPNVVDNTETIYDDVQALCDESDSEEFEKLTESEEETYDDVGVYWKNKERVSEKNETSNKTTFIRQEVHEKNLLNKMSGLKSEGFYDQPEKCLYSYDDGEGERYQYISDKNEIGNSVSKESEFEIYQYIQNVKDDNNIYEDIQSIKSHLTIKDRGKDIYEEVNCVVQSVSDNASISNCYESVYNGIYSSNNGPQGYIKSDESDGSNNSGRSTYEKSNSLYGMSPGNPVGSDHCLNLEEENDSPENSGYHLTLFGAACPNSETSQSNSDEWIEVSDSESEETIYLVHERPRRTKTGGSNRGQKDKRRWKELQRKSHFNIEEAKLQNSEDHFYESVGQYENAEIIQEESARILQIEHANSNSHNNQFYNDEQYIDDFDSQSSEDEAYVDAKLPDVPNHGINITKSLKAAGKKLRKNFSLRKSDLSKSLKRFKKSRPKVTETVFTPKNEIEVDITQKVESPTTPTNHNNSIYSNNSDSSGSSHNFAKSVSTIDLKNQRHRRSWTFRSKFKSNSLDPSEGNYSVDSNRNSTFYLSLNDVQPKKMEKKDELLSEIQSVLSKRSSNSSESISEKNDKDTVSRISDASFVSAKHRPSVPPPPPPAINKVEIGSEKTKYSDILWGEKIAKNSLYVESGLFDKKHSRCTDSDASLYAEIGLYATNEEMNSSRKTQMFVDEPLYQFYTECVNQRARDDILNNYDSEGYEEINDYYSVINEKRRTIDIKNVRPNFEDFNDDVRPKISSFRSISDRRTLWCQIPAVVDSCILQSLSEQRRKLQEAKFEIITSEGSYMHSLNILENHFMKKVSDLNLITKRDFRILFSNILSVKKCSEAFLEDLENCWQDNILLNGICDIVYKHSTNNFKVYTKYCKNQVCIYRTLRELLDKNWNFENALKEIESDPICQNLNIHSFLMLPMQRITRLPLLLGAVLARMEKTDDEYEICKAGFDVLNKIVQDCDDEARRMEKCEEMLILSQQIEFPKDIRRIPIITGSRFLVKSGQVTQLVNRDENKLTFGKKFSKVSLTLFLFTDLLIIAKKKNPRNYVVVDHCPRNLVQMQTTDGLTQLPVKLNTNSDMGGKLLMLLTMLENHEKKTVEMILSFEMESDRQRWLEAVTPKLSENPNECIYEEWDCPQVIALYEFTPVQPDELSLCIGDVVNVLKKMNDGWYQGERLRDGARGWFPQNHTQEVSSSHVRAKNKKLRYKLLALSGNLIDSQKMTGK